MQGGILFDDSQKGAVKMNDNMFRIFKLASQGYCCTQIMLKMALEDDEMENADLIRAVNGLCAGIAYTKETCGVLTGGICLIGLYAGKGEPTQECSEDYVEMMQEYVRWFEDEFKSKICADIIGDHDIVNESGGINYPVKCGNVILKGYEKAVQILLERGYEYGERG